jgi:hypothetical protein
MIKVIITTFTATLAGLIASFSIFMNGILGAFGLAATSVETVNDLRASQAIVEKMRKRHETKKLNVSKKFVKRSGKKIASTSVAAATIGTAAVAVTVAGLEVHDYCEEKEELLTDENILFGTDAEFDYQMCLEEAQKDSESILISVKDSISESVAVSWEHTKDYSAEKWSATKKASAEAWDKVSQSTEGLWERLSDWKSIIN